MLDFLLALTSLGSSVAFSTVTSITAIELYVSYGVCYHPNRGNEKDDVIAAAYGGPVFLVTKIRSVCCLHK